MVSFCHSIDHSISFPGSSRFSRWRLIERGKFLMYLKWQPRSQGLHLESGVDPGNEVAEMVRKNRIFCLKTGKGLKKRYPLATSQWIIRYNISYRPLVQRNSWSTYNRPRIIVPKELLRSKFYHNKNYKMSSNSSLTVSKMKEDKNLKESSRTPVQFGPWAGYIAPWLQIAASL